MKIFTCVYLHRFLLAFFLLFLSSASFGQYCTPVSTNDCSDGDDINSFSITGENNTAISDLNSGCSSNGYADNTTSSVSLGQGATYTVQVSSEYSSFGDGDYAAIWIDLNNNNTFESSELIGFLDDVVSLTSSNINITIPLATSLGNHRMRVTVYYPYDDNFNSMSSATVSPCNTGSSIYEYGETQDYNVNVVAPPLCPTPTSITASVTSTTATISWTGTGNYIIEYGTSGFTPGTGATAGGGTIVTAAASSQVISNLTPQTSYDFYVRHDCSAASNGFSSNASALGVVTAAANDLCSSAITLVSAVACTPTSGSTVGATTSGDNSFDCENFGNYGDVWYSFQATHANHDVSIGNVGITNVSQSDTYYGLAGYSGDCATLTELNCQSGEFYDGTSGAFTLHLTNLTVGQTYYLRFWKDVTFDDNFNLTSGDVTFDICVKDPAVPPVNDNCVNAVNIPVTNGFGDQAVVATTLGATTEDAMGTPQCAGTETNDVWFTVTVPASGNVVIQSSASNDSVALDLVMEAYSGTCGALTLITCNDDGNPEDDSPSANHPRISLMGQTPGAIVHIRMLPINDNEYGPFNITAWDSTTLPPVTTAGACAIAPTVNIDSATGNLYRWVPLLDASGNIIAELFANGNALGAVSASTYINTGAVRQNNGVYYLDRNVTITPTNQPTSDVKVRLYILNQEVTNLETVDPAVTGIGSLNFSKNEDACQAAVSGATTEYPQTFSTGYGVNGAFVELNTSSFSSFFIRSGTTPLPILLTDINARNIGAANQIEWTTADEIAGNYFELQRSADSKTFSYLDKIPGKVKASNYIYTDNNPLQGVNYYRLKITQSNGTSGYSKVVQAVVAKGGYVNVEAYPNPTNNKITLKVYGSENGDVTLTDLSGSVVYHATMTGSELSIDMGSMVNGFYLLHYSDGKQNKVIKVNKQ